MSGCMSIFVCVLCVRMYASSAHAYMYGSDPICVKCTYIHVWVRPNMCHVHTHTCIGHTQYVRMYVYMHTCMGEFIHIHTECIHTVPCLNVFRTEAVCRQVPSPEVCASVK